MVIKGWDVGVASMKKGEKALFKIRSEYAYGDSGSPPKIPEKATLNFEVELLSWVEGEDITENKDEVSTCSFDSQESLKCLGHYENKQSRW